VARHERIVVLTGAGLSAESGLATFRDKNGIWAKHDYRKVATPEGFAANPELVHAFYNKRRRSLASARENDAHVALARLEHAFVGEVTIVTQNIDSLHEAAGSESIIHIHGQLLKALCSACGASHDWSDDLSVQTLCPSCGQSGGMRPDVVWFGEMPYAMERIVAALSTCTMFLSIGTSGHVYPAAGFVQLANDAGAKTVELNLEPSQQANMFDESILGPATSVVPAFVDRVVQSGDQQTENDKASS